jgi:hypothetical protein
LEFSLPGLDANGRQADDILHLYYTVRTVQAYKTADPEVIIGAARTAPAAHILAGALEKLPPDDVELILSSIIGSYLHRPTVIPKGMTVS